MHGSFEVRAAKNTAIINREQGSMQNGVADLSARQLAPFAYFAQ